MALNARNDGRQHLGEMLSEVTHDLSTLLKDQVALTKAELKTSAQTVAKSSALLLIAAFFGLLAVIFLLVTLAYVLAIWLPVSAGFGIVALLLLIITVVAGLVGKKQLEAVQTPEKSVAQFQKTKEVLSHPGAV
jgi:hypothetical protein